MRKNLSDDVIKKCFNLCETVKNVSEPNIYGKLYQKLYDSEENYIHYYPRLLILQLTSGCNLRCKHCFFAEKQNKYGINNNLTKDEILQYLRYFVEEVNILHCTITGGEIFFSDALFDVIEYLKQHNVTLKLITNGTLITATIAERLGKLLNPKYDLLQVSLDGATAETNDAIRGSGVYCKVLNSIKLLTQNNCNVELGFTINAVNVNEIPDLFLLAKKYGVKKINYGKFTVQYDSQKDLIPDTEDIFINIGNLSDIYDGSVKLRIPCIAVPDYLNYDIGIELMDKLLKENTVNVTNLKCKPHDEQVTMFANGDISLCYDCTIEDIIIGNIKTNSFEEIWKNRFENPIFKNRDKDQHACRKCKYISLCKTGCPYRSVSKYGSTLMPGYDCTYYEKLKEFEK